MKKKGGRKGEGAEIEGWDGGERRLRRENVRQVTRGGRGETGSGGG